MGSPSTPNPTSPEPPSSTRAPHTPIWQTYWSVSPLLGPKATSTQARKNTIARDRFQYHMQN
ncbi:hypothetical protein E2C01_090515 [Portunus trituberculatus]|uniref:Uncharacterized protein n=1 Tax=Portunus trituberculatus TaxID=210409 RepID=A0A5B7JEW5_PORTR|nr:hypothetical protein [Portunus trituberculatus]